DHADAVARLRDPLRRHRRDARPRVHADRLALSLFRDAPRLARRRAHRLRHELERPLRQPAEDHRAAARVQPGPDRHRQQHGRRHGQDDRRPEHRRLHGLDRADGAGGTHPPVRVLAQHRARDDHGRDRDAPGVRLHVDDPEVRRFQLIELEDQPWFPRVVRDLATDYLQFIQTHFRLDRAMAPVVSRVLDASGTTRIVDLCSGGSGPLLLIVKELAAAGVPVSATLTDLYPNVPAFEQIAAQSDGLIAFETRSVDARNVPADLGGLRTIFNGFHHLKPEDARSVLHAAASARQPIAIFELSERSWRTLLGVLGVPIVVWITTPFMRPFLWRRLFWTYLVPAVPFTCLWDGVVSQLRAYTLDELHALCEGSAPMRWDAGQIPIMNGRGHVTYLVGSPA